MTKESLDTYYDELGKTLGEALLMPTKIYVKALKNVKDAGVVVKDVAILLVVVLMKIFLECYQKE